MSTILLAFHLSSNPPPRPPLSYMPALSFFLFIVFPILS